MSGIQIAKTNNNKTYYGGENNNRIIRAAQPRR